MSVMLSLSSTVTYQFDNGFESDVNSHEVVHADFILYITLFPLVKQ